MDKIIGPAVNEPPRRSALFIAGPTASGKSSLALHIARLLDNPLIINCDSMQVYSDLSYVTARPSADDQQRVDHALYGHRDGAQPYSVANWRDEVRALRLANANRPLIFVGGTGLYFKVLLEGLSPVPTVDGDIRKNVRRRATLVGSAVLHGELDAAMASQLSPTDSQRVCRALEVLLSTGRSLADWQAMPPDGGLVGFDPQCAVVLDVARDWLEKRIAARAVKMMGEESLGEVARLADRQLCADLPVMRAIGVAPLMAYLNGEMERKAVLDALIVQTRRYAKRQQTWFKGQMGHWPRCNVAQDDIDALAGALAGQLMAKD